MNSKINYFVNDLDCFEIEFTYGKSKINAQMDLNKRSDLLVIAFHGNIDQKKKPHPVFQKKGLSQTLGASVLSVADPSLQYDKNIGIGWYLGSRDCPAQSAFLDFFGDCINFYSFKKVVFMGGSGGGYAALYFSWHFPNSVAIVINPQTVLQSESLADLPRANKVKRLIKNNFNRDDAGLCLDVCNLYESGFDNLVVYLQNGECAEDVKYHSLPFFRSAINSAPNRIVLKIDYWGIKGHSGSVPFSEIKKWISAVANSSVIDSKNIYSQYYNASVSDLPGSDTVSKRFLAISEIVGTMSCSGELAHD